ncbi:hypothetical protein EXN66_Car017854 [Channa argus]|uniref:Uncharacterized protein n=1 Tax=Channa argus TaxID=215402 RepID=A0A6G1QJ92_CHAAH|nr:hypothetical protein EXN66_Car017854 [Channa argus]
MDNALQTNEIMQLNMEETRHMVDSFFQNLTHEQLEFFKLDKANDATKAILTEFLLDLIVLLTKIVLGRLKKTTKAVSEKHVQSTLSDTLPQTFADALHTADVVHSASSVSLTSLISQQVATSVNSALSARADSAEPLIDLDNACPSRLDSMVHHASQLIKDFVDKIKTQYKSRPGRKRSSMSPAPLSSDEHTQYASSTPLKSWSQPGDSQGEESLKSPDESLADTTSKAVEEILRKEVSDIVEPLLSHMSEEEFDQLESGSLLEIREVADDIAETFADQAKCIVSSNTLESIKAESPVSNVNTKIKRFFTKQFARASVFRMMTQLKAKFFDNSKVKSSRSVQVLLASVDSVFQPEDKEDQDKADEYSWVMDIPMGNYKIFSKSLTNFLQTYSDGLSFIPEPGEKSLSETIVFVTPSHAIINAFIRDKVQCFFGLMKWWLKNQEGPLSERVTKLTVEDPSAAESFQALVELETKKMTIRVIVEKLLTQILTNTQIGPSLVDVDSYINWLSNSIWDEVQYEHFELTKEILEQLYEVVYKDLCRNWSFATKMITAIYLYNPLIAKTIATTFKNHLINGPQKGIFGFSSFYKAISKPFKK